MRPGFRRPWIAAYATFGLAVLLILATCYVLGLDTLAAGGNRQQRLVQLTLLTIVPGIILWRVHIQPRQSWPPVLPELLSAAPAWLPLGYALLALAVSSALAVLVFQSIALSGDEGAYVLQSEMFARGQVSMASSPVQDYVGQSYIFPVGDRLISQYPPGWPAVLALAQRLWIPVIFVNPIIAGLTVIMFNRFALRACGAGVAAVATVVMTATGFFLFNSASFFSGSLTALLAVLFAGAVMRFLDQPSARAAMAAGFWFSAIAVVRHFDAMLFAAPFVVALLRHRWAHWRHVPSALLGAVPLLALLLSYYAAATGAWFLTPQTLRNSADGLLGANWHVARVSEILVGRVIELAEWTSPPWVVALVLALLHKLAQRRIRIFDVFFPLFLVGYWLYWADGGLRWGPRYIYPALPFMALTLADAAADALRGGWGRRSALFAHLVCVGVIVSVLNVPSLALRGRELYQQTQDIPWQASRLGLRNAVVLVLSGTGLIWRIGPGDLARNGLTLDGRVIYAHGPNLALQGTTQADAEVALQRLAAYFPGRQLWTYRRSENAVQGTLTRVTTHPPAGSH